MQEYVMCTDGKKRKAVKINCKECGKEHLIRIRKQKLDYEFCSLECARIFKVRNGNTELCCAWCKTSFMRRYAHTKLSRSGLYFCTRKCKDEAQKLGGIKEIQPPHYGTSQIVDYRALFDESELHCTRCGYNEFTCAVEIHHIDKDRNNNDKSNLIPLCSCCHMAYHRGAWDIKEILGSMATGV